MLLQPVFRIEAHGAEGMAYGGNKKKRYKARMVGGEVAEDLFDRGLCLPSGTAMTEADLDRICRIIRFCCRK